MASLDPKPDDVRASEGALQRDAVVRAQAAHPRPRSRHRVRLSVNVRQRLFQDP